MKDFESNDIDSACDFIAKFEGVRLLSYKCPAGVWTIGYGHTGEDVCGGMLITEEEAYELLRKDVENVVSMLSKFVEVQVTEGQFIALTSLAFNVGVGSVKNSRLLRKLNDGDYEGAAEEFTKGWNTCGGKVLPGLTRRREAEKEIFSNGC